MPRIYTSTSDPVDFCKKHMPSESIAKIKYGHNGDGPDDRGNCFGYDAEHPDYSDDDYRCIVCKAILRNRDN